MASARRRSLIQAGLDKYDLYKLQSEPCFEPKKSTYRSTRCSIVPSPSRGMRVSRMSSIPLSSKNFLTACPIILANLLEVPVGSPITLIVNTNTEPDRKHLRIHNFSWEPTMYANNDNPLDVLPPIIRILPTQANSSR